MTVDELIEMLEQHRGNPNDIVCATADDEEYVVVGAERINFGLVQLLLEERS